MHSSSILQAHSPLAQPIVHLSIVILTIMFVIMVLVTVLVVYASIRYRQRPGQPEPEQNLGNTTLELTWTILPFLLLVCIFCLTVITMKESDPSKGGQDPPPDLTVIGHQFWWELRYPGFITANEVHIPVNRRLLVRLEAADVIHDFWVPNLSRKMDMVPGHPNQIWLEADRPGTYLGTCAEFCGNEHAWMRIRVIAQSEADFQTWEAAQAKPPATPATPAAIRGADFFRTSSCSTCHAVRGISDTRIGPDLTHIASRETLAAGRLDNNAVNLEEWLHDPERYKPGSNMPNASLSPGDLSDLTAYLETLQ
jgi:cytochrome c oxidase subunit 2